VIVLNRIVGIFVGLLVAALGVACLVRPAAIQAYVIRTQSNTRLWQINPFSGWMQRPSYRAYLRFMGIVIVLFAALIIMGVVGILQR